MAGPPAADPAELLLAPPPGCPFHPRCRYRELTGGLAETERPELVPVGPGHQVACHLSPVERERIWADEIAPRL